MTQHTPDMPLGSWLANLPDERLIRLLELRPDLAQPAPGSIAALAMRAQARQSVRAATDELDFLRLALIDALLVLHADTAPVPVAKLLSLLDGRAPQAEVVDALDDLKERALVWGDTDVRVPADAGAALPWYPGQAVAEDDARTENEITWTSCTRARRWAVPATPRRARRRTARCRGCWPRVCCAASTPRP
jgi:hypothetical protein